MKTSQNGGNWAKLGRVIPFPWTAMKKKRSKVKSLSHVRLFVTPWTVAHQAPLSMGLSRQEYWSGLPFREGYSKGEDQHVDRFTTGKQRGLWKSK